MKRKQNGLAPIAIILSVALLGGIGILGLFKSGKIRVNLPQLGINQKPTSLEQSTPSKKRSFGNSKLDEEGTINTPSYEDEIEGSDILAGGVVTKKLKSGITAYFIIPPNEPRVNYAEIGEFRALPSSQKHIPLYTDSGYGINVAVEDKLLGEAYLVFDFNNGKRLEQFKKLASQVNYCDYSTAYFNPQICAVLINLPSYQDTNFKYLAARPKFISRGNYVDPEEHQPTHPQYSYSLGTDDLLILKITQNDYVVPQPNKSDLIFDLAKDSFEGFPSQDYSTEMLSLLRSQNFTFTNLDLLAKAARSSSIYDLKSYFNNLFLQKLIKAQRQDFISQIKKETADKGYSNLDNPDEILQNLEKDQETNYPIIFEDWVRNAPRADAIAAANLRRAFNTRLKGSAKALTAALRETRANLIKLREDLERTTPVEKDIVRLTRAASILTSAYTYNPKTESRFHLIPYAFAQRVSPPPQSYYPPIEFPRDDAGDTSDVEEEAGKTEEEVTKSLNDLADAILDGTVSLPIPDILDNLGRVLDDDKLAEKWQKVLDEAIRNAMKNAVSQIQKYNAYIYCKRYVSPGAKIECGSNLLENKSVICAIRKIPSHGLKILAPFKDIELDCKALGETDEPEEEPDEPPLEPLKP